MSGSVRSINSRLLNGAGVLHCNVFREANRRPLARLQCRGRRLSACAVKGGAFQWVQGPPGDLLAPEAIGAVMEVTKWLKPSNSGHELVTARVCRPQRE